MNARALSSGYTLSAVLVFGLFLSSMPKASGQAVDPFFRMGSHAPVHAFPPAPSIMTSPEQRLNPERPLPHDGTRDLKPQRINVNIGQTVPFWSGHFDYRGLRYPYTMVGSDPQRGSATTVVPVELIPIRWVFSNGVVLDSSTDLVDGQTAIQGMLSSPIFSDYDFVSGGTHVGNTQFGDAFQRANFWNTVSTRAPNYHVRLAPTVFPSQTVNVPDDKVTWFTNPETGAVSPFIDELFLDQLQFGLIASLGISPKTLPVIVWGAAGGAGGAGGWHGAYQTPAGAQTYIAAGYSSQAQFSGLFTDVAILGHEVIEWMDDPFATNYSAGWDDPFFVVEPPPRARCDSYFQGHDLLETADPFETLGPFTNVPVTLNGYTYSLPEGAFIDFFTRNKTSRSVNGQYSFFEIARPYGFDTPPSADCVSSVATENTFLAVPGADFTWPFGINDRGEVVGYFGVANRAHGFIRRGGRFQTLDYPGAIATLITGINNSGDFVGFYIDHDGYPHGFAVRSGRLLNIDYPGAADTVAIGINDSGDIVGEYNSTQPITTGFVYRLGGFTSITTPFGSQSVVTGISKSGILAGSAWSSIPGPSSGWTTNGGLARFDFPDASYTELNGINTFGDTVGFYRDPQQGFARGLVTLYGYPYETRDAYIVYGINSQRQIVGQALNFNSGEFEGFIGNVPLANNGP